MKGLYVLIVVALVANGVLLLVMRREMEQLRAMVVKLRTRCWDLQRQLTAVSGRRASDDDVRIVNGYRVRKTTNNPEAELKKWLIGAIPRRHNQAAEEWIAELTAFYKWFAGQ